MGWPHLGDRDQPPWREQRLWLGSRREENGESLAELAVRLNFIERQRRCVGGEKVWMSEGTLIVIFPLFFNSFDLWSYLWPLLWSISLSGWWQQSSKTFSCPPHPSLSISLLSHLALSPFFLSSSFLQMLVSSICCSTSFRLTLPPSLHVSVCHSFLWQVLTFNSQTGCTVHVRLSSHFSALFSL